MQRGSISLIAVVLLVILAFCAGLFFNKINFKSSQTTTTQTPFPAFSASSSHPLASLAEKSIGELGISLVGKILYQKEEGFFISNLDGSEEKKVLGSEKSNQLGYAGFFNNNLYYTTLNGNTELVYKKNLTSQKEEKIFEFEIEENQKGSFFSNAKLDSSEKQIAYSFKDGLAIYNLETKQNKILAETGTCKDGSVYYGCYGYSAPLWSSDSQSLAARKFLYEGAVSVLFNLSKGNQINPEVAPGGVQSWSTRGRILAVTGKGFGPGSLYLLNNLKGETQYTDVLAKQPDYKDANVEESVAWSGNNRIAFINRPFNSGNDGIYIYDEKNDTVQTVVKFPEFNAQLDAFRVLSLTFLPQDNGLLILDEEHSLWIIPLNAKLKAKLPMKALSILKVY